MHQGSEYIRIYAALCERFVCSSVYRHTFAYTRTLVQCIRALNIFEYMRHFYIFEYMRHFVYVTMCVYNGVLANIFRKTIQNENE